MKPEVRQELEQLLSALCDEQLGDEEFARLEALLDADAECRRLYLEYVDMHAGLLIDPRFCEGLSRTSTPNAPESKATPAPAAAARTPMSRLHWGRENIRHALLVLGALAASILVQVFWMPPLFPERQPDKPVPNEFAAQPVKKGAYVATLVQSVDCVWDTPGHPAGNGARLAPGKLRLPRGVASIRFDGGPELIVEGPAEINLDSATGVTVLSGKVVFRTTDSDVPFDLRTPASTLVDIGTECAVSVSAEGEEVHVFEGELQRVSKKIGSPQPENLKAGDVRHYALKTDLPRKPAFAGTQFVRHIVDVARPAPDPAAGLLAYEGFDYANPLALQNGKAVGGIGWDSPWRASSVRPVGKLERERLSLNVKDSLVRTRAATPSVGGSFDYAGSAKTYRKLARPIPLDTDGIYYLSFLFRRQAPADPAGSLALVFWTDDDYQQQNFLDHRKRLYLGVKGSNQLDTHLERMTANASMPLSDGVTYLLVAKIAASRSKPDQVFLRVFGPDDLVKPEETGRWSVQSPPFRSDLAFEWIEMHVNGKSRQTIDEIRVGTTWLSVMAPWIGAEKEAR